MQLRVGTFNFAFDSVAINDHQEKLWNEGGQLYGYARTLEIKGYLYGATGSGNQTDMSLATNLLINALQQSRRDIILFQNNGAPTPTKLIDAQSITGVRILKGPTFPEQSPDYVNFRKVEFTAYAEFLLSGVNDLLYSFEESLEFGGGYPIYGFRDNLLGPPQKQKIYPQTAYTASQVGSITGLTRRPTAKVPPPIFPDDLIEAPKIRNGSPKRKGNGYLIFPIHYEYHFKSVNQLQGTPNLWIS